jgi:hypothetical protein
MYVHIHIYIEGGGEGAAKSKIRRRGTLTEVLAELKIYQKNIHKTRRQAGGFSCFRMLTDSHPSRKFHTFHARAEVMAAMTGMAGTDAMPAMHAMVEGRRDIAVTGAARAETSGDMRTATEAAITMMAHRLQRSCSVFGQKLSLRAGRDEQR